MTEQLYYPLNEIVKRIVDVIDPDRIILFGSRSTGNNDEQSDFDICVLKHGIKNKRKLTHEIYHLLRGIMVPIDVIVDTPEQFMINKVNKYLIYSKIADEGKIIYEK